MNRFDPAHQIPLFGIDAFRPLEAAEQVGLPSGTLVQRAGYAIARLAAAIAPHARTIWLACGPGNNGADGLEAATVLNAAAAQRQNVAQVLVSRVGPVGNLPEVARAALERAQAEGVQFVDGPPMMDEEDLCIDAILGLGARPFPAEGWLVRVLQQLDSQPFARRLSVDLPTGLDANSGTFADFARTKEPSLPHRRHTLSLLAHKPGLFTGGGRDAAGTIWLDTLGVDPSMLPEPDAWLAGAPRRREPLHASHKGWHGDVLVVGGEQIDCRGVGMTGAVILAGTAALHAGAGRVMVCILGPTSSAPSFDGAQPDLMMRSPGTLLTTDLSRTTVVCGCGGGQAIASHLPHLLRETARLVLDADALNSIASDRFLQQALQDRAAQAERHTILTPHPLEAARLLESDARTVQSDRIAAARRLSDRYGCTVMLKGSGTVVSAPKRIPSINPTGNGRLGTAGTGDVLAGLTGARLASGLSAFDAAVASAYEHGHVADHWPVDEPLTASALSRRLLTS